jgi:hypothetical protein
LFASLVLLMAAAKRGGECLGRCGASSGHTTNLKQYIFFRYVWHTVWVATATVSALVLVIVESENVKVVII